MKQHYKKLIEIFKGGWNSVEEDLFPITVVTWLISCILFIAYFIWLIGENRYLTSSGGYITEYINPVFREFVLSYVSEPVAITIGICLFVLSVIFTVCHNVICDNKGNYRMRVFYWFCWNICSLMIVVKLAVMLVFSFCWIVLPTIFYYLPNMLFASKPKPKYSIEVKEKYEEGWCRGTRTVNIQVSKSEYMIWKTNNLINEIDNRKHW